MTAHSGAAMDRVVKRPSTAFSKAAGILLAAAVVASAAFVLTQRQEQTHRVESPQLAAVIAGEFRDELALRGRVEPLRSVQLDAVETGLVEAVFAAEGDWVEAGAPLYRLQSPEHEQLLLQRSAEVAQQMANVSLQRSALVASLAQNRRELAQLEAAHQQAESNYQRFTKLADTGYVSAAALEQSKTEYDLAKGLLEQAREDQRIEADIRKRSLEEMARAVEGLQRGLQLLERSRDRLEQRAPMTGRLSGFQLRIGTSVQSGDRLGRIDDPASGIQLLAEVDEFFLPRLEAGQTATSSSGTLVLAQTLPQVQNGKARVLLRWPEGAPKPADLRPGQAVDIRLQLSAPNQALLLPDGPGVESFLYVRVGDELRRRSVKLGRRAAGQVEVLGGLRAGDEVLISQPPSTAERLALP